MLIASGHTVSWGKGVPRLLTECYDGLGQLEVPARYDNIMPIRDENYVFLQRLFAEIFATFPDAYVHLGGDEIDYGCWYYIKCLAPYRVIKYLRRYSLSKS